MIKTYSSPLETLMRLQKALEGSMASDWFGPTTTSRGAFPPINVFQENDVIVIITEIPGVAREDINVEVKKNQVRLYGKKTIEYGESASIHRRERDEGNFDRTIAIPFDADSENVKAEYRDGILALHVPRAEQDKPRVISID